jgi:ABC-type sugar transport system ATPase subunit
LLRLVAGFEKLDSGKVIVRDRDIALLPPEKRDVGFVFQTHALYPHLTARENLEFPLKLRNLEQTEIAARVKEMAGLLRIESLLSRRPAELSGGEAQRVALGRALIRKPAVLLMDEPLSSLPPDLRLQLRHELARLHSAHPTPLLYVTHDHEDALAFGQRLAVLDRGVLQQIGRPQEIYEKPANRFVAGFVGKPSMNMIDARRLNLNIPGAATIGIRPEHLKICSEREAWLKGTVTDVQYGGAHQDVFVRCDAGELLARIFGKAELKVGNAVPLRAEMSSAHAFDAGGKRVVM